MNERPSRSTEWLEAIDQFLSGRMTDREALQFHERLRHEESARLVYVEYLDLHGELLQIARRRESDEDVQRVATPTLRPSGLRTFVFSACCVALGLLAALTLIEPTPAGPANAGRAFPSSTESRPRQSRAAARIVRTIDIDWTVEMDQNREILHEGDTLDFRAGMVEVEFESGAKCILAADAHGLAEFVIDSPLACSLKAGLASFKVPPAGRGFVVHAAGGRFIDLGTEFGVRSDGRGTSEIHVLKGKVQAETDRGGPGLVLPEGAAAVLEGAKSSLAWTEFDPQVFQAQREAEIGLRRRSANIVVALTPPGSFEKGLGGDPTSIHLIAERQGVRTTSDGLWKRRVVVDEDATKPKVDSFRLPVGVQVNSFLVHAAGAGSGEPRDLSGELSFDRPIIAVITDPTELDATTGQFGIQGLDYRTAPGAGLEVSGRAPRKPGEGDRISFSTDRKTLRFRLRVGRDADRFRILTSSVSTPGDSGTQPALSGASG